MRTDNTKTVCVTKSADTINARYRTCSASNSNELTKLVKQTEKLAEVLGKAEKQKTLKTKTKEKDITKKVPTKAAKKTYTDKVLAIIKRSKKGVNTDTLMEKTGLDRDQVQEEDCMVVVCYCS